MWPIEGAHSDTNTMNESLFQDHIWRFSNCAEYKPNYLTLLAKCFWQKTRLWTGLHDSFDRYINSVLLRTLDMSPVLTLCSLCINVWSLINCCKCRQLRKSASQQPVLREALPLTLTSTAALFKPVCLLFRIRIRLWSVKKNFRSGCRILGCCPGITMRILYKMMYCRTDRPQTEIQTSNIYWWEERCQINIRLLRCTNVFSIDSSFHWF